MCAGPGAEGHLVCLRVADGKVVWARDLKNDYGVKTPLWGFASHPFIEGHHLYCMVGGKGATVVAFDKQTGAEVWTALDAAEPGCNGNQFYVGVEEYAIYDEFQSTNMAAACG